MKITVTNWTKIKFSLNDRLRVLFGANVHVKTVFIAHHVKKSQGECLYHTSINEVDSAAYIDGLTPFQTDFETSKKVDLKDNFDFHI